MKSKELSVFRNLVDPSSYPLKGQLHVRYTFSISHWGYIYVSPFINWFKNTFLAFKYSTTLLIFHLPSALIKYLNISLYFIRFNIKAHLSSNLLPNVSINEHLDFLTVITSCIDFRSILSSSISKNSYSQSVFSVNLILSLMNCLNVSSYRWISLSIKPGLFGSQWSDWGDWQL